MAKQADVSSTTDAPASVRPAGRHFSYPDARSVAMSDNEQALRWGHITRSLAACDGEGDDAAGRMRRRPTSPCDRSSDDRYGMNATIEILERPSSASAVLSWRDPTGCSYGYQLWHKGIAKQMGTCVLSGTPIRRGDAIFRPCMKSGGTSNRSAMILAAYIDRPQLAPRRTSRG
ncbi:DUF3331 domain-containing protein [Trinickia mobilis]|uniref:DUF3331 domain-containing protein n=1 Tax=Trinickia mobilis TaxID=2816356 RepID=UPI001A8D782F|nr:DUF3331 domain-containing protein [Trinickia mobilis]